MSIVNWKGADGLRPLLVPVDECVVDPDNVKLHGERSVAVIARSFQVYGQQKSVVFKWFDDPETGRRVRRMVAGSGSLTAVKRLGWTHLAVSEYDGTGAPDADFAVIDNRSAELAEWDADVLGRQAIELAAYGGLEDIGFTDFELAATTATFGDGSTGLDGVTSIDVGSIGPYDPDAETVVIEVAKVPPEHVAAVVAAINEAFVEDGFPYRAGAQA